jgi:peptidoglycan/xylan/chitin deacetylase (PgdA/CDA1 family)
MPLPPIPTRRRILQLSLGAFSLRLVTPRRAQAAALWPTGARGAVSLTYDDGLNSQLDYAVPELDRRGLTATFFLTEENAQPRIADWEAIALRGHEIADHTISHPCDMRAVSAAALRARELAPMEAFLDANFGGGRLRSFAYPCGYLGLGSGSRSVRYGRYQRLVRSTFRAARTTAGGPNTAGGAFHDPFHLHGFEPTYDADVVAPAARYLRHTLTMGGWAIFVFHEVRPRWMGEGDVSTAVHSRILDLVQAQGLWCAPMNSVLNRLDAERRLIRS